MKDENGNLLKWLPRFAFMVITAALAIVYSMATSNSTAISADRLYNYKARQEMREEFKSVAARIDSTLGTWAAHNDAMRKDMGEIEKKLDIILERTQP